MRQRIRRRLGDDELERARQAPAHAPRRDPAPATPSTALEDHMLGLQHSAGNQAVAASMARGQAAPFAQTVAMAQRVAAPAPPAPAQEVRAPAKPDFAAMWREEVIIPLGRVTFLVEEEGIQLGAMRRLTQALKAILEVLQATPREDPNWHRLQLLGRMVNALVDLVAMSGTSRDTDKELLDDMIIWRYRAAELEPLIKHAPRGEGESAAEAWHHLVVLPMGRAQVRLEQSPAEAIQGYLHAVEGIALTLQATPKDDPARLRIASLSVAVGGMLDRLELAKGMGKPDVAGRAIEAFQAAEALGERLAGKSVTSSPASAEAAAKAAADEEPDEDPTKEPDFTWEKEGGPVFDSDQLERP